MSYDFLLILALIAFSTKVLALIAKRLQLPRVVGFLVAGLLLGPAAFGIIEETEFLWSISELGVVMIMFLAGVGTRIPDLKEAGKPGFLVAMFGVIIPLVMGAVLALICEALDLIPEGGLLSAIFIGTILTATSVSITVEALKELGKLRTSVGNTILAAALIDDVLGLIALTIVCGFVGEGTSLLIVLLKIVLFFIFAFVVAIIASKGLNLLDRKEGSIDRLRGYPIFSFALCLIMAYCAEEFFGVADIIGAYAAGLAVSTTPKSEYVEGRFEPLNYILLTPVFFVCVGLKANISNLNWQLLLFAVLLLLVAIVSKVLGCGLGAKVCGFDTKDSLRIGWGMASRGEVALIVADRAMSMGVLGEELMTPIVITVVGCAILTPVLLKQSYKHEADHEVVLQESRIAEHAELTENLDILARDYLKKNREMRENKNK